MGNDSGYVLPMVVNPPTTRCFTIEVPNDRFYIAAFMGQLWELTRWYNWARDEAHTAIEVAAIWKTIYEQVRKSTCPDCSELDSGTEVSLGMADGLIQVVPSGGKCLLQYRCCLTDPWITVATVDQTQAPGQPGAGAEQPTQNGGQACYDLSFNANSQANVPTTVSAGDQISIQSASGAGTDGSLHWFCVDGSVFFAGACNGQAQPASGDPAPTLNHMALIMNIGGTWYPATVGSIFTVPAGVSASPIIVQTNDGNLTGNSGSYKLSVCVTNNQAGSWTKTFDFTLNSWAAYFALQPGSIIYGQWIAGTGWETAFIVSNGGYRWLELLFTPPTTLHLLQIQVVLSYVQGGTPTDGDTFDIVNGSTTLLSVPAPQVPTSPQTYNNPFTVTPAAPLIFNIQAGRVVGSSDPGGTGIISKIILTGTGTNPFPS